MYIVNKVKYTKSTYKVNQYFSIINHRTLITLFISLVVPYICYHFKIVYNIDLTLISIAIIFPLVFAIRGAFKRREKGLEHMSKFRSALISMQYTINGSKLIEEQKAEMNNIVLNISKTLLSYLKGEIENQSAVDLAFRKLESYLLTNEETVSNSTKGKLYGFLQKAHEGAENCMAIHIHRTPISLKAYCKVFIYIFPMIYTPTIINKIGFDNPEWLTYFVVILSEFILISLYNIQDDMEYPFDDQGLDDIKLDEFKLER